MSWVRLYRVTSNKAICSTMGTATELKKCKLASKFASYVYWLNIQRLCVLRKLTALQAAQKPFIGGTCRLQKPSSTLSLSKCQIESSLQGSEPHSGNTPMNCRICFALSQ